jgi:hypothetical protein
MPAIAGADEAMAKDLKPEVTTAPHGWQWDWICANVYSYGCNTCCF